MTQSGQPSPVRILSLRKKIVLFVSTGDTCRSPMAAGYFRKLLAERNIRGVDVRAAGVMTVTGLRASQEAQQVMEAVDVDLGRHRSSQLTQESIRRADLILGMSPLHVQHALRESPDARGKTFLLKEFARSDLKNIQISDPMGCTLEVFKKCFKEIRQACDKLIETDYVKALIPPADREPRPRPVAESAASSKSAEVDPIEAAEEPATATKKTVKASSGKTSSPASSAKKSGGKTAVSGKKPASSKSDAKAPKKSAPKPAGKSPAKVAKKAAKKTAPKAGSTGKSAPSKKKSASKPKSSSGKK